MRNQYKKHKDKWSCRNKTNEILNRKNHKKINSLKKQCKCGSTENLEIHHEIYPTSTREIKQAILDGKIYYLCIKCHGRRNNHDTNKHKA